MGAVRFIMDETLNPKQLSIEGQSAYKRGDYQAAARAFEAASQAYATLDDALNAAELANNASVAYLQSGEAQAALQILDGTAEVFRLADDVRRQAMAIGNQAAALEALGRLDEAIDAYQQSADLLKQAGEDQLRLNVMQILSALQLRTGRQLEALASMKVGLDGVEKLSVKQRLIQKLLNVPFQMMDK
jgi:tetratricopeptide (TPR) repeat protein